MRESKIKPIIWKLDWKCLKEAGICCEEKKKIRIMTYGKVKYFFEKFKGFLGIYKMNLTLFIAILFLGIYTLIFLIMWWLLYYFLPTLIPNWLTIPNLRVYLYLTPTIIASLFAFMWSLSLLEFEILTLKFENLLISPEIQRINKHKIKWTPAELRAFGCYYLKNRPCSAYELRLASGYTRTERIKKRMLTEKLAYQVNEKGYVFRNVIFKIENLPSYLKLEKKKIEKELFLLFKALCLLKFFSSPSWRKVY